MKEIEFFRAGCHSHTRPDGRHRNESTLFPALAANGANQVVCVVSRAVLDLSRIDHVAGIGHFVRVRFIHG